MTHEGEGPLIGFDEVAIPPTDLKPFDFWWKLYGTHCPRMKNKQGCQKKFNTYSVETQREIYKDVGQRVKYFLDWQEDDGNGKRKCMNAPEVYLNQRQWESPVDKPRRTDNVRDTTNETVSNESEIRGLKKMIALVEKHGGDLEPLKAQLQRRLECKE